MPRVIITVPEKSAQPYRFKLDREVVSLGRGSDNDIVIDSGSVSGKHAEMHRIKGGYELADSGSTNGIKHNGNRQQKISLRSGMSVKLGDVSFDFTLSEEELAVLDGENPSGHPPLPPVRPLDGNRNRVEPEPEQEEYPQAAARESEAGGIGMILLFLVLAAVCFAVGLGIRHEKDTGESLIKAVVNKDDVEKAAPAAAPPAEEE